MTVSEYVSRMNEKVHQVTFIKARARKDAQTPFYHAEYQTTSLLYRGDVAKENIYSDYIVLNDRLDSIAWLSGADWNFAIRRGYARCLLIISPADLETLYPSSEQNEHMIRYIEDRLDP